MFGASVAMLSHSAGRSDMLVGAPGASGERGAMYRVDQTGGVTSASWRKVTGPTSGAPFQPRFGSALAVDGASGIVLIASDRAARDRTRSRASRASCASPSAACPPCQTLSTIGPCGIASTRRPTIPLAARSR